MEQVRYRAAFRVLHVPTQGGLLPFGPGMLLVSVNVTGCPGSIATQQGLPGEQVPLSACWHLSCCAFVWYVRWDAVSWAVQPGQPMFCPPIAACTGLVHPLARS